MSADVLRVQGDYQIQTAPGGSITLNVGTGTNTGTVVITGNLDVQGRQTTIESVIATIKDSTIILNQGEPNNTLAGGITNGTSGIQISRGNNDSPTTSAFLEFNNNAYWHGSGTLGDVTGVWEFRVGPTGANAKYGAIRVNAIRIDEASASTSGAGAGQGTRLNILGADNPTSVISVSGTNNYEARVTDKDDIPNKAYVDATLASGIQSSQDLIRGHSYFKIIDNYQDGVQSELIGVLNGDPAERITQTTGTVVLRITPVVAQFAGVQFVGNQIQPIGADTDLLLAANGTGKINLAAPLIFQSATGVTPNLGQTNLYTNDPGSGGTGMYYINKSTGGTVTSDEFVSRKKALVFSLIF
jgi:hypothetical protein